MKNQSLDIKSELRKEYFLDVDVSNLDVEESKRIIIERIFMRGSTDEMKKVVAYYGRDIVVEELCKVNYLDSKTLNFVSKIFKTPKSKFKCYRRKQSRPAYWDS